MEFVRRRFYRPSGHRGAAAADEDKHFTVGTSFRKQGEYVGGGYQVRTSGP
jgi:hypothetical protein